MRPTHNWIERKTNCQRWVNSLFLMRWNNWLLIWAVQILTAFNWNKLYAKTEALTRAWINLKGTTTTTTKHTKYTLKQFALLFEYRIPMLVSQVSKMKLNVKASIKKGQCKNRNNDNNHNKQQQQQKTKRRFVESPESMLNAWKACTNGITLMCSGSEQRTSKYR